MRPDLVVIGSVIPQNVTQLCFVEHHQVIERFAPNRADEHPTLSKRHKKASLICVAGITVYASSPRFTTLNLLLTRFCASATKNWRRSSRLFVMFSSLHLLGDEEALALRTHLWSAPNQASEAIAPPRRTFLAFPEKPLRYAFVRR